MSDSLALSGVGPVLISTAVSYAVIQAIKQLNSQAVIQDHGAYLRVYVPGRCLVTRDAIENSLGRSFTFPGDLELIMPSFKGRFTVTDDVAIWEYN